MTAPTTPAQPGPVAYLVNIYPKVSHSFVRREILALERLGLKVHRFAQRGWEEDVVDPEDVREKSLTQYILKGGALPLALAWLRISLASPLRFWAALKMATRMSRQAEKPLLFHLIYLAEACWLLGPLKSCGARHLHAHFGTNSAEIAMLTRVLGGPPYSFTVHGPEEFDKALMLHLREKIRRCAFVVAVSSFGRSQLYRWAEYADWAKVRVVHCGLEPAFHLASAGSANTTTRLLCIGRLCEQKGQMLLLSATRLVLDRGVSFDLVLAGDGEMRRDLELQIDRLGLRQHVRITGWISSAQVRDELNAARAMVLPSFAEGLPVVIMEAMALGRPVLTTYVAGIPELVCDGENGWLFPAGDVQALADAMRRCLAAAPDALEQMSRAARGRVLARHDVDTEARKLAALFAAPPLPSSPAP